MTKPNESIPYFSDRDHLRTTVAAGPIERFATQAYALLRGRKWRKGESFRAPEDAGRIPVVTRYRQAVCVMPNYGTHGVVDGHVQQRGTKDILPVYMASAKIYGTLALKLTETEYYRRRMLFWRGPLQFTRLAVDMEFQGDYSVPGLTDRGLDITGQTVIQPHESHNPAGNLEFEYERGMITAIDKALDTTPDGEVRTFYHIENWNKYGTQGYLDLARTVGAVVGHMEALRPWVVPGK